MSTAENRIREQMVVHGESLYRRGLVPGSSGNLSVRVDDGILVTPTNSCMGRLDPATIAKLDLTGKHKSGDPPSKEAFLHLAFYRQRTDTTSVAHLHSCHAVALACREDIDPEQPIAAMTPYFVMKLGRPKLLPYFPPGDKALADAVEAVAQDYRSILLANHGPVVAGRDLDAAVYAIEELEEAAKLQFMLEGKPTRLLSEQQIRDLADRFTS